MQNKHISYQYARQKQLQPQAIYILVGIPLTNV